MILNSDFVDEQTPAMVVFERPWFDWATVPTDGSHIYAVHVYEKVIGPIEVWFDHAENVWKAIFKCGKLASIDGRNLGWWSPIGPRRMTVAERNKFSDFFRLFSLHEITLWNFYMP